MLEIIIAHDGGVYDLTILWSDVFKQQAERVIKKLPFFEPGLNNDEPVAVSYTFPITFKPSLN